MFSSEVVNINLDEIRAEKYFSILADETKDVQNKEQLSMCLRWVDNQFCVHEDVMVFVHVIKTDSESLSSEIVQAVDKLGLNLNMCRGQGYDGAANMSGHLNGVGVRIQRVEPTAIPVHCFAHCLNLCLQDASNMYNLVRDSISVVKDIVQLISNSPKRNATFDAIKKETSPSTPNLRPL